jgi:hypothetical protein
MLLSYTAPGRGRTPSHWHSDRRRRPPTVTANLNTVTVTVKFLHQRLAEPPGRAHWHRLRVGSGSEHPARARDSGSGWQSALAMLGSR